MSEQETRVEDTPQSQPEAPVAAGKKEKPARQSRQQAPSRFGLGHHLTLHLTTLSAPAIAAAASGFPVALVVPAAAVGVGGATFAANRRAQRKEKNGGHTKTSTTRTITKTTGGSQRNSPLAGHRRGPGSGRFPGSAGNSSRRGTASGARLPGTGRFSQQGGTGKPGSRWNSNGRRPGSTSMGGSASNRRIAGGSPISRPTGGKNRTGGSNGPGRSGGNSGGARNPFKNLFNRGNNSSNGGSKRNGDNRNGSSLKDRLKWWLTPDRHMRYDVTSDSDNTSKDTKKRTKPEQVEEPTFDTVEATEEPTTNTEEESGKNMRKRFGQAQRIDTEPEDDTGTGESAAGAGRVFNKGHFANKIAEIGNGWKKHRRESLSHAKGLNAVIEDLAAAKQEIAAMEKSLAADIQERYPEETGLVDALTRQARVSNQSADAIGSAQNNNRRRHRDDYERLENPNASQRRGAWDNSKNPE